MRIDQDIHFELLDFPVKVQLDTAAPDNRWILTPQPRHPEDTGLLFKQAVERALGEQKTSMAGENGDILVAVLSEEHAIFIYEDPNDESPKGATMATNIMIGLPDWDGDSFHTLPGGVEFADFLCCLEECGGKNFRRSDGRPVEFKTLARPQV